MSRRRFRAASTACCARCSTIPTACSNRDQLTELIHGREAEAYDRAIDVQVSRLRQRLRDDSREPQLIKTVRGEGYVLAAGRRGPPHMRLSLTDVWRKTWSLLTGSLIARMALILLAGLLALQLSSLWLQWGRTCRRRCASARTELRRPRGRSPSACSKRNRQLSVRQRWTACAATASASRC